MDYGMNGLKVQISFNLIEAQVLLDALSKAERSEQTISVEKLYEFLDSTSFLDLDKEDVLELFNDIAETGKTKVNWCGEVYDLNANESQEEN